MKALKTLVASIYTRDVRAPYRLTLLRSTAIVLICGTSFIPPLVAQTYDVANSFEQGWTTRSNPNGVWTFGFSSSFNATMTPYNQMLTGTNGPNTQSWFSSAVNNQTSPAVEFNNGPAYNQGNVALAANQFALVAGVGGQFSDVTFTAPAYGVYSVVAAFQGAQSGVGTVVGVVVNGTVVLSSTVTSEGQTVPFNQVLSLNTADTVRFSVGPGGGKQNTALAATITTLPLGYVNPKYLIMGVTYAPPGGSSSSYVSYQNTTFAGNTSMNSSSFANGFSESVSVGASIGGLPGVKAGITETQSNSWTQKSFSSNTVTINNQNSTILKTPGVPTVYSPVDHDYDIIWLWLNPVVFFAFPASNTSAGGSIEWNGYGYDLNDPLQDIDVWPVYVGYLNGDFGPLDSQDVDAFSRSWAQTQTFAPGQGPGITSADYSNILSADPFALNPYDSNSGYTLSLATGTNPPTSKDGRFTLSEFGNTTPQSIPYSQAPPDSTQGVQETYQNQYSTTTAATEGATYTYKVEVGLDASFTAGSTFFNITTAFKDSWTMTWENTSQTTITNTSTQTDTAQITGPPCPATTAPCNPIYTEPHEFAVYQDNLYGTFMFWPNPYFSISGVTPATKTVAAGGTASYIVTTLANAGYPGTSVTISVTGLPAGATNAQGSTAIGSAYPVNIGTSSTTPTGPYQFTIKATDGSLSYFASATLIVTAVTPSLSSLSPNSVTAGGPPFSLTVNGSGFVNGSTVQWNGSPLLTGSYVNGNPLTASVPTNLIASPGSANVTVMNPGGATSNPLAFTIIPPAVSVVSLNPVNGSGNPQIFNATYASSVGAADLNTVYLLFNSSLTPGKGCYASYVRASNALYLYNDAGSAVVSGVINPGTAGTLSNSQCTIGNAGAVTISGNNLTLPVNITFAAGFASVQNVYGYAANNEAQASGFQELGTWTPGQAGDTLISVHIDGPVPNATLIGIVPIGGWAIENTGAVGPYAVTSVSVFADGTQLGMATYDTARPDVCAAFPGRMGCPNVGWSFNLNVSGLRSGSHTLMIVARDSAGNTGSSQVNVTVGVLPYVDIDAPLPNATLSGVVGIGGWAIEDTVEVGPYAVTSVFVLVDGNQVGTATYGVARPDVCAAFPARLGCPNVGWSYNLNVSALAPGSHSLKIVAMDSAGNPGSSQVNFTVGVPPYVDMDAPLPNATLTGVVGIGGWAIENTGEVGPYAVTSVFVLVDGNQVGTATYGIARPDVCAAFPARLGCPNVGWSYNLNVSALAPGSHILKIVATDSVGISGSSQVNFTSGVPPSVEIDAPVPNSTLSGVVAIGGWAIENTGVVGPNAIASVSVLVDGTQVGKAAYGIARPDVCAAYPARLGCPDVGWSYNLNVSALATGSHTLTVVATDVGNVVGQAQVSFEK